MYNFEKLSLLANELTPFYQDCAITVALKIADDSCKMDAYEKSLFVALYDAITRKQSDFFDATVFDTISSARETPSAQIFSQVKSLREDAMEMITRPKMKAFKAFIRQELSV